MSTPSAAEFPLPPALQEGFWQWDKMHCPRAQTPLTEEIFLSGVSRGFSDAMDEFACPVGIRYQVANYYAYLTVLPQDLGDEPFEERLARYKRTMDDVLPRMGDLWANEWLPSIQPGLERARSTDYQALDDDALLAELERMSGEFYERYVVHGRINFVMVSASLYADAYNEALSPEDPTEPYHTLQGYPTRSLDAGRGLWALRETILASAELRQIFETGDAATLTVTLEGSAAGRTFLEELRTFLDEFAWRSDVFELADPTWREDPTIPLNILQGYIRVSEDEAPDRHYEASIAQREQLLAQARERLAGEPEQLGQIEGLHAMASHYLTLTEDHNYYIDQIGNAVIRLPILELGRRLVERGWLESQDDVFLLYTAEIQAGLAGTDRRALAGQRRAEMARWAEGIPPPVLGEPPPPSGDPLETAIQRMFGLPVEPSRDPSVLTGIGASHGTARGTARVVHDLSEASKVEPGDVLVCEMTMPAWTPLFSTVSAVVADTGGVLSHCAIVSREYGLPCVVGTMMGTAVLQDGMTVTVDGGQGLVRIEA